MQTKLVLKQRSALKLRFHAGATGPSGTIEVGTVTTGAPGSDVIVTNVGTPTASILDFTIPEGDKGNQGDAATIAVGDVTTGAAGSSASVTNVGTSGAAIFDFAIPKGDKGDPGTATIPDGDKGDVTTADSGDTWHINNGAVTAAHLNAAAFADQATVAAGTDEAEIVNARGAKEAVYIHGAAQVATLAALADLPDYATTAVVNGEGARDGLFTWNGADMSAQVTSDPAQGVYVAPSGDATGASGVWVRVTTDIEAKWFGLSSDPTDAAANLGALQAAVDFARAYKLVVRLPAYDVYVDGTVDISECSDVTITGRPGTRIITTSTSAPIFEATGVVEIINFTLSEMTLTANSARTADPYVHVAPMIRYSTFREVIMQNWGSAIALDQFVEVRIENCTIIDQANTPPAGGYGIKAGTTAATNQGANLQIFNSQVRGKSAGSVTEADWTVGLLLLDVEGVFVQSTDFGDFDCPVIGDPQTRLANCFFDQTYFDASFRGPSCLMRGSGVKSDCVFSNSWFASAGRAGGGAVDDQGGYGFHAKGTGAFGRMIHTGCTFTNSTQKAVAVTADDYDGDFIGCTFYGNSLATDEVAFYVDTDSGKRAPSIRDCRLMGNGGTTSVQYVANCSGFVIDGLETDTSLDLLGVPARAQGVIAANSRTVAVSGSNLPIPQFGEVYVVSSGGAFSTMPASWIDRSVTLLFAGTTTVNAGGNLTLAGGFSAGANSTLTLMCIGSSWVELARKA